MAVPTYDGYKWRSWLVLAGAFLVVFFHRYSTGVVANDLTRDLGLTGTQVSNLASMYFYAYALMQIPSGLFSDFVGPRRTTMLGMLLAGLGAVLFGLAPSLALAYFARLLVGLGVSVVFISLLKIQAVWFAPTRYATMTGMASLVGNVGGILATTPLALLVLAIGWRNSFVFIGSASLLLVGLIWLLVVDRPEHVGLESRGVAGGRPAFSLLQSLKMVAAVRGTWVNFVVVAGLMSGVMSFSGMWGVPYLVQVYGFDNALASRYVLLLNLGILVGSALVGWVADRLGQTRILIIGGSGALTLFWFYVVVVAGAMPPMWLLGPLYFAAGVLGIVFMLCFANTKAVNHPQLSGTATGVVNIAGFLTTALANVLIGWRLDSLWDGTVVDGVRHYGQAGFQQGLLILVACSALAFVASFALYEPRKEDGL